MNRRTKRVRGCCYAVAIDADASAAEVAALAAYLSTLSRADCEVLVIDDSPGARFDSNRRVLRWVGRHVAPGSRHRSADGAVDLLRAAVELAGPEKVIVAGPDTRCSTADIAALCSLLDRYELVEPEEYVSAASWWGGVEAGRILLHRGLEQPGQVRSTFAIRRSAYRQLLEFEERSGDAHLRRLITQGVDHYDAYDLFVRREPARGERWLRQRVREAASEFSLPFKTAFFLAVVPLILLVGAVAGAQTAAGYAAVVAFASVLLAVKGRSGAGRFFPLHTCLMAPLWVAERSISVYWALIEKLRSPRRLSLLGTVQSGGGRAAQGGGGQ